MFNTNSMPDRTAVNPNESVPDKYRQALIPRFTQRGMQRLRDSGRDETLGYESYQAASSRLVLRYARTAAG